MADGSPFPDVDMDALLRRAQQSPDTSQITGLIKQADVLRQKEQAEIEPFEKEFRRKVDASESEAEKKRKEVEPVPVEKWEQKLPEANPIQEFGSLGSVFGLIASAFTHQPMVNGLNAAAAAMNASRANQLAEYYDAFNAWKENTNLALKRHEAQREDYSDALEKVRNDATLGAAEFRMLTAKYNDPATALYNELGAYEKLADLEQSRSNAALGIARVMPELEKIGVQRMGLMADPDWNSNDPAKKNNAYQRWFGPQSASGVGLLNEYRAGAINKQVQDFIDKNGHAPNGKEYAHIINDVMKGKADDPKLEAASKENDALVQQIDGLIAQLDKNPDIAGTRGMLSRGLEAVKGIVDPHQEMNTPATQFKSDMTELREKVAVAITGSKYYSARRAVDMQSVLPGIENFTSAQQAKNSLIRLRAQLQGAGSDNAQSESDGGGGVGGMSDDDLMKALGLQ